MKPNDLVKILDEIFIKMESIERQCVELIEENKKLRNSLKSIYKWNYEQRKKIKKT